jgi:hypothetical protein
MAPSLLLVLVAVPLLLVAPVSGGSTPRCAAATSTAPAELSDGSLRAAFGPGHGALTSLQNLRLVDGELLADVHDPEGNPFRLVLGPQRQPPSVDITGAPYGDPSYAVSPWPDGALGGAFADAHEFQMVGSSCGGTEDAPSLAMSLRLNSTASCGVVTVLLNVTLAGTGQLDMHLSLATAESCELLVGFGWLTGVRLTADPMKTRAVQLFESGQVGAPAWLNAGGFYGEQVSMQWQSVWADEDAEDDTNTKGSSPNSCGLTVWAADIAWQPKLIHRFPVNLSTGGTAGGMGVLYPAPVQFPGGSSALRAVAAPFRILIHGSDWRAGAGAYSEWFNASFRPRPAATWLRRQVHFSGMGFGEPDPKAIAKSGRNFSQFMADALLDSEADMIELTGWWQATQNLAHSKLPMQMLDGEFWPPRADMGGVEGLRQAIQEVQQQLGRKVCLYVCAAEVSNATVGPSKTPLFNSSAAIWNWSSVNPSGEERPAEPGMVRMCRGWAAWQVQVAEFVARILRAVRPNCVRLDCVKAFENCYNEQHHHASALDSPSWNFQLVRRVRQAMDAVDKDTVLMTEGLHEAYYAGGAQGGLQEPYMGKDIAPMRAALPGYFFVSWNGGGAIEAGMNGFIADSTTSLRREFPYADCDEDFMPCPPGTPMGTRMKGSDGYYRGFPVRPLSYPQNSFGWPSMWHALRETFVDALFPGKQTGSSPSVRLCHDGSRSNQSAGTAEWVGRAWEHEERGYTVLTGGNWNGSGGSRNGSASGVPTASIRIDGLTMPVAGGLAYYLDANLTIAVPMAISVSSTADDDTTPCGPTALSAMAVPSVRVKVPPAFGALLLPSASAPALVLVSPSLQPGVPGPAWPGLAPSNLPRGRHWDLRAAGAFVDVDFRTFAPWQASQQEVLPIAVNISAPGLLLNGSKGRLAGVVLPATVRFSKPPSGTLQQLQLTVGSRFVRVEGAGVLPLKRWVVAAFKSDDDVSYAAPAESMLHQAWSPTVDVCSLDTAPVTKDFTVSVERTAQLLPPNMSLQDSGHAFVFANGDVQVKVSYGANISHAIRSSDGGASWRAVPQQPPPFQRRTSSEFGQNSLSTSWGEVLTFSEFADNARAGPPWIRPPGTNGSISAQVLVSTDNGLTMSSRIAQLWLPPALKLTNMAHAGMVELSDRILLSYSYAHWEGIDGFGVAWPPNVPGGLDTSCHNRTECISPWRKLPCVTDADCQTVKGTGHVDCGGQSLSCRAGHCFSAVYGE